jgi:acyl-CoA reductase-like NAD-dependent aldehyde dehydrogenase
LPPFPRPSWRLSSARGGRDTQPGLDADARIAALRALEALLRENAEALCAAVDADFRGRARHETRLLEIFPAVGAARHAAPPSRALDEAAARPTNFWFLPGRSRVMFQPLGVVGIVVPWNYPIYLAVSPAVAALAAGNRALVKMSEAAPRLGELFARLVAERFDRPCSRS